MLFILINQKFHFIKGNFDILTIFSFAKSAPVFLQTHIWLNIDLQQGLLRLPGGRGAVQEEEEVNRLRHLESSF